jgi:hypothetical protein
LRKNIFAHDLRRTTGRSVAKAIAVAGEKMCCKGRAMKLQACKKALFHRTFCNSRLTGDLPEVCGA